MALPSGSPQSEKTEYNNLKHSKQLGGEAVKGCIIISRMAVREAWRELPDGWRRAVISAEIEALTRGEKSRGGSSEGRC